MLARAEATAGRLRAAGYRHKSAHNAGDAPPGPWYRIQNKADDPTVAQVDIYDEIDWLWGVTSRDFRNEIKALPDSVTTIDLHINSPGGDVYEALAIMNTLRQHKADVVTTVDGYAASSAGFIAVGASDELIMARNSELMAHLPWAITVGDAADMRKMADDLDRIATNIASIFADRAGGTVDEWVEVLNAETWWSAQEAVDAGLADRVLDAPKVAPKNRFDLSIFNHAGRVNAPAPPTRRAHNKTPRAKQAGADRKEPTVALSESALQKLGLDADADEDAINEAITNLPDTEQAPPDVTIEEAAKVAAKFGQKLVNTAQYDQLVATVADLSARRDAQVQADNEAAVTDALASGRIDAKSADTWRAELAKNRDGTLALLATLPANKAVPVDEIGHGVSREDTTQDAEMATVFSQITGKTFGKDA
jgi:ATP-dependent Clp endopeptidase proteolytic subunit ClpP